VSSHRKIEIIKGTSRFILIVSSFSRVVFKIPRIRLWYGLGMIIAERKKWNQKETWDERVWWSIGWCLYKGILDNWREYRFYRKSKHLFLQPTIFSLFGLINIQKRGDVVQCDKVKFWCCVSKATNGEACDDGHHFSEIHNFCLNGGIKVLDYGSPKTQALVKKYGSKIMEALASNFPELNRGV